MAHFPALGVFLCYYTELKELNEKERKKEKKVAFIPTLLFNYPPTSQEKELQHLCNHQTEEGKWANEEKEIEERGVRSGVWHKNVYMPRVPWAVCLFQDYCVLPHTHYGPDAKA